MDEIEQTRDYTVYDESTGEVLWSGHGAPVLMVGQAVIFDKQIKPCRYVLPGDPPTDIQRPTMSPRWNNTPLRSDGLDAVSLLDLPNPCRVIYEGPGFRQEGEVVGGVAEFTTDVTGPHRVTVSAWPYLDWSEELDAI